MAAASEVQILNTGESPQENLLSAVELSKELQKLMLKMKGNFISEEGRAVDYSALKESDLFKEYLERTKSLKAVDLGSLERTEKIAFFLIQLLLTNTAHKFPNISHLRCVHTCTVLVPIHDDPKFKPDIYNSLTIHSLALCDNGIPSSVLEINNFWRRTAYNIGGYTFSLDDIEHGILRGNRAHPSGGKPLFGESDPRLQFTVTDVDPRIHFALVCGAKSCPAINVFTAENLDRGLQAAAESFCSQEVCIDSNKVILSKIFLWYKADFGSSDNECLRWICQHLSKEDQEKLNHLLEALNSESLIKVSYSEYNWNLNGSKL